MLLSGNLTGFNYDGTSFSSLPFKATFVTYFKNGYREYRNSDGSGGWSADQPFFGQYADNGGNQTRAKSRFLGAPLPAAGCRRHSCSSAT